MGEKQGGRSWLKGKSERDDFFTPNFQPSCDGIMSTNYNSDYPMIARHGAREFLSTVICILFCTTNFREGYLVVLQFDIFGQ